MRPLIKIKPIAILLLPLVLACFALLPSAQALTASPDVITDPDETFPNFNTAAGLEALLNVTTGISNTAYGARALRANTTGGSNLAIGGFALINNIDGGANTAVGNNAMFNNQHGSDNMALGQGALAGNVSGSDNVAMGAQALAKNKADGNVGVGFQALNANGFGEGNTAVGFQALLRNGGGGFNTAMGNSSLLGNVSGSANTAVGHLSLFTNISGRSNTAVGQATLTFNTSGHANTAVGTGALFHNFNGSNNTAIGNSAGDNIIGSGNVDVGWNVLGAIADVNKTRIKNIGSTAIVGGTTVVVASTGGAGDQVLGFASSSRRYKRDIKPMGENSETLFALKPVTFRPDDGVSPSDLKLYGLIAEDVGKVNPDLVAHNDHGEVATIRYEAINAMLLNEFLKEHQQVKDLKATIAQQQKQMDALTAGLQKVSDQLELRKPAPQTVANNQ